MKLAFYKASGTITDKLIRLVTLGKYSHCELVFTDGTWFSACAWENKCRFKEDKFFNHDNWDFIDYNCDEELVKLFCKNIEGSKYDYKAIITWFFTDFRDNRSKWYCSEVCHEALGFVRARISPSGLYKKLVNISK